jgi:monoamine oxidase
MVLASKATDDAGFPAASPARDRSVDVAVLGAGMAGLTAAATIGAAAEVEILDAAQHVGGRTKSHRLGANVWANFGAQYVSDDKVKVASLAQAAGVELVPAPFGTADATKVLADDVAAEVREQIRRVEVEQRNRRAAELWELDDQSFISWLGPCSEDAAAFWDHWSGGMMCSSITEVSLYGVLWFWGEQRTTPWIDEPVDLAGLGCAHVVRGGTNQLAQALARVSGSRVSLRSRVTSVAPEGDGYVIEFVRDQVASRLHARAVICALPAPIAAEVCPDLPGWKRQALEAVRYGRFLSTPIQIAPADQPTGPWRLEPSRPRQSYNGNDFRLRTPGDPETDGAVYHSYVYDVVARQIWDDPDESIKSGAIRALLQAHPEYADRIAWVGLQRWLHGLPRIGLGHMKRLPSLRAPVGGLHFCGDYCSPPNMEGATRNGERAALEAMAALGLHPPTTGEAPVSETVGG